MPNATPPIDALWAKHARSKNGSEEKWLSLRAHLADSGRIAGLLWDHWLPRSIKRVLAEPCSGNEQHARAIAVFLTACHDIGKATPAFNCVVPECQAMAAEVGYAFPGGDALRVERRLLPHGLAGQIALQDWLVNQHRWSKQAALSWAIVVGSHHGVPPTVDAPRTARARKELLGDSLWEETRLDLLERSARFSGIAPWLSNPVKLPVPQQVLLTAFVIVTDWMASNSSLFPLTPLGQLVGPGSDRARSAWEQLKLDEPWTPNDQSLTLHGQVDEFLAARFPRLSGAPPREVQTSAILAAREMSSPGLLIVEAPMGSGKTEIALCAAEIFAQKWGLGGLFVALPTRATADAMFPRVVHEWLGQVPTQSHSLTKSVALLHGKAAHNDDFHTLPKHDLYAQGMSLPGGFDDIFTDDVEGIADDEWLGRATGTRDVIGIAPHVHGWFTGRKRANLADFTVGTIDQLLLMCLKSRHVMLRHLAMARKVVVLDEVHAVDVTMGIYLKRCLEWLGAYDIPVIALSATLPPTQRSELIAAYERGRDANLTTASATEATNKTETPNGFFSTLRAQHPPRRALMVHDAESYPLITSVAGGSIAQHGTTSDANPVTVCIGLGDDSLEALATLVRFETSDGGCVLVLCNTVRRAVERARYLEAEFGSDVFLTHSRFVAHDRAHQDAWLRSTFGPRSSSRPHRAIVVATQVAEQSLDVDFDLLITDIAPMDLILQRIGRMHRHIGTPRPPKLQQPRCVVVGATDWTAEPPVFDKGAEAVYGSHLLLRTTSQLVDRAEVSLPNDIAPLVRSVYGDQPLGPAQWQPAMSAAATEQLRKREEKEAEARAFLIDSPHAGSTIAGWITASAAEPDETPRGLAQVRDSDDSFEVIMLVAENGALWMPPHLGLSSDPIDTQNIPTREQSALLSRCMVRIPSTYSRWRSKWNALITELERRCFVRAWQTDPTLIGQLVLEVTPELKAHVAHFSFTYSPTYGLEVTHAPQ